MATTILWLTISVIAQSLVIIYPGVFVFWFVFHSRIKQWRTMGKRAYLWACMGWPLIGSILLLFSEQIFRVRWAMPWWILFIGIAAVIAAVRIGIQASRIISRKTLFGLVELEPERNVQPMLQTGIYAKTRNPVYLAHWLIILAAAALSGYAANWVFQRTGIDERFQVFRSFRRLLGDSPRMRQA